MKRKVRPGWQVALAFVTGVVIGVFFGFFLKVAIGAFIGAAMTHVIFELLHRPPPKSLVSGLYPHRKEGQC